MNIKILSIGVVKKEDKILLRKKPEGSPPYQETWYIFGGAVNEENTDPDEALKQIVLSQTGVEISVAEHIGWDTEVKQDHDGEKKLFIYLDCICEYTKGDLRVGEGIEKLEWVHIDDLENYDLVPPSVKLFKKLGYLRQS